MNEKIVGVISGCNEDSHFIPKTYLKFAKEVMGGRVRVICSPWEVNEVDEILLPGGRDIDPTLFGNENYASRKVYSEMDKLQEQCIDVAVKNGINIFGICRGFQLLYYRFLIDFKHLSYAQHIDGHNQDSLDLPRNGLLHKVRRLGTLEDVFVNSFHHQGVLINAPDMIGHPLHTFVTDYSAPKNAMVLEGFSFRVGESNIAAVQFHPEELSIDQEEYSSYFNQDSIQIG